ncbi:hypothetical protein ACHWQZ_G012050 [Mnemiopsis leidyi]
MSSSDAARQEGNEIYITAGPGVAPVVRIERYQKSLIHYQRALQSAINNQERSSAYKNLSVTTQNIAMLLLEQNKVDMFLFYVKECFTYGNKAVSTGKDIKSESWIKNINERLKNIFSEAFDWIMSLRQAKRIAVLHRFSSVPESKHHRTRLLKQLAKEYFNISVVALEKNDYKESIRALTEMYTPLTKLEELASQGHDMFLEYFVDDLKEDCFKNRCIAESLQKRMLADELLESTLYNTEELDMKRIWQVIDHYTESIVLTRENDVEQEAISLTRLGILYHKVLLQKTKAKEILMRVLQLAQCLYPRNLNDEKWFRDASDIISEYQQEQKRKEEKEWEKSRQKYVESLMPKLHVLQEKMNTLSIQKILVWLYTQHCPKHCKKFNVDVKAISEAPGDSLKKLLAKAIVHYHPDKIDAEEHGMEYKVWCEEIVKNLTAKYEMMKGV